MYPRLKLDPQEPGFYHVINRTVQQTFLMEDTDKEYFISLLNWLINTYYVDILSFQILDNHYHLILKIMQPFQMNIEDMQERFLNYYGPKLKVETMDYEKFLNNWSDLSKFMKDLNERFAKYMNKKNNKKGHFWEGRYRNTILDGTEAILSCMRYIDLNAVRAKIVSNAKEYLYGTVGYIIHNQNKGNLINLDLVYDILSEYKTTVSSSMANLLNQLIHIPKKIRDVYTQYISYLDEQISDNAEGNVEAEKISVNSSLLTHITCFSKAIAIGSKNFLQKISHLKLGYRRPKFQEISLHEHIFFW